MIDIDERDHDQHEHERRVDHEPQQAHVEGLEHAAGPEREPPRDPEQHRGRSLHDQVARRERGPARPAAPAQPQVAEQRDVVVPPDRRAAREAVRAGRDHGAAFRVVVGRWPAIDADVREAAPQQTEHDREHQARRMGQDRQAVVHWDRKVAWLTPAVEKAKTFAMRAAVAACLVVASCGRSQGVPDRDLRGLVEAPSAGPQKVDVDRAAKSVEVLGVALGLPHHVLTAALGPHTVAIATATHVTEAGTHVTDLDDKTSIEVGASGAFHAVYTNSADYGREVVFTGGTLYLRPRYQRWHERAPETPNEPEELEDQFYDPVEATWELLAPGIDIVDRGTVQLAGRTARKLELLPATKPRHPAAEPLAQRKWRESRTIEALTGEVMLDADHGVPLSVKLSGTVGFMRDGRRFSMQVSVQSDITAIGKVADIAVPAADEVVATPERLREVDDRDFLLQGIAPPLRKRADGTAVPPQPRTEGRTGSAGSADSAGSAGSAGPATKPKATP